MHDLSLIAMVAAAFTAAWFLGLLTQWLGLSPIVGYLLAGVLIGPHTPGFVGDIHIAQQLAEVGVILLMFGVGLHFRLKDLYAVRWVAVPGAVGQSLIATLMAMWLFSAFGMPLKTGAVLGMAMAVASTVVLMRVLMDADVLDSPEGHVAVGWLIVEDIFTVVLLVLIPVLSDIQGPASPDDGGGGGPVAVLLGIALLKLVVLAAIMLWAGSRIVPWVLVRVARLRSRELFTLTVLVSSIAVAAGSYFFFGASMALGAFLAGMVVGHSPVSHQAAADALPMRDAFAVLFFVSVGMLFDPAFLLEQPLMVAAALGIILIAKPLAALFIVMVLGHSVRTALTVAVGLAQIGEFSFILSELARQHALMTDAGHNLLVAAAIISITLNPLVFRNLPQIESWLRSRPRLWQWLNGRAERRGNAVNRLLVAGQEHLPGEADEAVEMRRAVVVGYGPVGRSVHSVLKDAGIATVIIDSNMDTVAALSAEGQHVIFGDASNQSILRQAGVERASHMVITLPDASQRAAIVTASRNLSATLRIVVRARYLRERDELERSGATAAVFEEAEAAVALARLVLADTGLHRQAAEQKLKDIRLELIMDNMSNLRSQRVATVMVPWARVRALSTQADQHAVLGQIAQERFSRWPVIDPLTQRPSGYLLAKDLIADTLTDGWLDRLRPLKSVHPDDSIETTLARMQDQGDSIYLVEDATRLLGLITLEDILEQVFGRLEDEHPHEAPVSLGEAIARGGMVPALIATKRDAAIRELVMTVPRKLLPAEMTADDLTALALAREEKISTDLGNGIALPHARCPGLGAPLVVVGHSRDGINYSPAPGTRPVRLLFLLVTPAERPESQLALLSQLARIASNETSRAALFRATSLAKLRAILQRPPRPH